MHKFLLIITLIVATQRLVNAQVYINEVCPANADINYDPKYYNFSGWIELYNKGTSAANIGGFYVSDNESLPLKWKIPSGTSIPAGGYLLIWCDGMNTALHTNFELDSEGESVVLTNAAFNRIDKFDFPEQLTNISYGRTADGGVTIGYLTKPTPGTSNTSASGTVQLDKVSVSLKAGRYSGSQSVSLTHSDPNAIIRFTKDGSEPTEASTSYTGPIAISGTTTLKAKAFKDGNLPSKTEVKTYFLGEHSFGLPVVSISMNPKYLWNNTIGIYADGTNGVTGNCQNTPFNWNQDWSRHADLEFFEQNGEKLFDQSVDLRIAGACSRAFPSKSLSTKARDKYGNNTIDEKLFSSKQWNSYGSLVFRNSGNDFWATMFRDALMQSVVKDQMDIDYLAYEPKAVYLNGSYWGILNQREKIDADYFEANYGIDKSDLDLCEWNALEGSMDGYNTYLSTLASMDLSTPEAFDYINDNIDVQEFINYLVTEMYFCNTDWPGNNVKFWRQRSTNGKWRWVLWDLDFGMALYTDRSYATHPTLDFATEQNGPGWPNPPWSTLHIRLLLQNPEFKSRLIETFNASLSTTFAPSRVIGLIDNFRNRIAAEMQYHTTRWGQSTINWNNEVQRLRDFATERNTFMQDYLGSFFGLTDHVRISIDVPAGEGEFVFNGISSAESLTEASYYRGVDYTIAAKPASGFQFSHWEITTRESVAVPLIDLGAQWKYFDNGTEPASDWETESYDDISWSEGAAQLGYGESDEQTIISYGSDPNNKYITTYFRKTISVADTTDFTSLSGSVLYDDGVVIYLNGEEVYRGNLPAGPISNSTLAPIAATENVYQNFTIPKGKIKPGDNVIAVELHQNGATSTDISFDLELSTVKLGNEATTSTTDVAVAGTANSDILMQAFFEPVTPVAGLVVNEVSARGTGYSDERNEFEDWIEVYNNGSNPIDLANLYFTDDPANKTKFRLITSDDETIINPGEYKVLFADEELFEGRLHLNFKLSADGESIAVYQKVGEEIQLLDQVTYDEQRYAASYSRIPNLTGPFIWTGMATPMNANQYEQVVAVEDEYRATIDIFPNPTSGQLSVKSGSVIQSIRIITLTGAIIRDVSPLTDQYTTDLSDVNRGVYIVTVETQHGQFVKKLIRH